MVLAEDEPFPLDGIQINAELEDGTRFFTYCHDCKKVLYCATADNDITKLVAREAMHDHDEAFGYTHRILIVKR